MTHRLPSGKINENICARSVLRQMEGVMVYRPVMTDTVTLPAFCAGDIAVSRICNHFAALGKDSGASAPMPPRCISDSILLPEGAAEEELRQITSQIAGRCRALGIRIAGGHTEVSPAVCMPVVTITGTGMPPVQSMTRPAGSTSQSAQSTARSILFIGSAGLTGSGILASAALLSGSFMTRFSAAFLSEHAAHALAPDTLHPAGAFRILHSMAVTSVSLIRPLGYGGVLAGLWKLGETLRCGLTAELPRIPLRQETIEIANLCDIDPYRLDSTGAILAVLPEDAACAAVSALLDAGYSARMIGQLTASHDRILRSGEERQFLTMPGEDPLMRVLQSLSL